MEPYSVAPMTKMQTLAMAKLRCLNGWRSSSGFLRVKAWRMNPAMSTTPRTKLTRTDGLVKLPVVPTSESGVDERGEAGREQAEAERRRRRSGSARRCRTWGASGCERISVTIPIGTLM